MFVYRVIHPSLSVFSRQLSFSLAFVIIVTHYLLEILLPIYVLLLLIIQMPTGRGHEPHNNDSLFTYTYTDTSIVYARTHIYFTRRVLLENKDESFENKK